MSASTAARPTPLAQAAMRRRSGLDCAPAAWMPAWIFSHTRGTPRKNCGRTSRRFSGIFSRLSAK